MLECALLAEEMGRVLLVSPFLSTAVLGTATILRAGGELAAELLPKIAEGSLLVTLAQARGQRRCATVSAGDRWSLTCEFEHVLDGTTADILLLACATSEHGPTLFAVDAGAPGVARHPAHGMDLTRRWAQLELSTAPARALAFDAVGQLDSVRAIGAVAIAAEAVGGATRCLELATAWAKERQQFGRPIGSFQAIKHRCVDLMVETETARAAVRLAARLLDRNDPGHARCAAFAFAQAARTYRDAAAATMQIHGGMGYTWDHDAHLHLRRAKALHSLLESTIGAAGERARQPAGPAAGGASSAGNR